MSGHPSSPRIANFHLQSPLIYFTLQGIIQGGSIFLLVDRIFKVSHKEHLEWRIYAAACLAYIVLITFEYLVLFVAVAIERIGIWDILLAFGLGIVEYSPIYLFEDAQRWLDLVTLLSICGVFAYARAHGTILKSRLSEAAPSDSIIMREYVALFNNNIQDLVLMAALASFLIFLNYLADAVGFDSWMACIGAIGVIITCVAIIFKDQRYLDKLEVSVLQIPQAGGKLNNNSSNEK